ncbi:MAG TPA: hypothetical protein VGR74_03695, partial [Actinomycetota bacterium]|nr:hypothetical protein [Actinomycetota bacterium]
MVNTPVGLAQFCDVPPDGVRTLTGHIGDTSGCGGVCGNADSTMPAVERHHPSRGAAWPNASAPQSRSVAATLISSVFSTGRNLRKSPATDTNSSTSSVVVYAMRHSMGATRSAAQPDFVDPAGTAWRLRTQDLSMNATGSMDLMRAHQCRGQTWMRPPP